MSLSQAEWPADVWDETAQQTLCVVRSSIEAHGSDLPEATTEDRVPARPWILIWSYEKRPSPAGDGRLKSATQTETLDQRAVTLDVDVLQVTQQASTLTNQQKQATT
jgi:hypothetical protein